MITRLLLIAALLVPLGAEAKCAVQEPCTCSSTQVSIAELRIEGLDGPVAHTTVVAVHDPPDAGFDGGLVAGSALELPRVDTDTPGGTSLAVLHGGLVERRVPVGSNGKVKCPGEDPDFEVSSDTAIAAATSQNCIGTLESRGYVRRPCNDSIPSIGCGCGAADGGLLGLVLLGGLARRRYRRELAAATGGAAGCE